MGGAHMGGTHMGGTHMGGGSRSGVFFGSPFYGFYGGGLYPYGYGYGGAYGLSYGSYGYGAPLLGGYYPQRYSYYPQYPLGGDVMPQAPALYASIRVILPDGAAKVQFDGSDTKQTGTERLFYTPDLDPNGGPYSYRIRAAWKVGDQDMVQERVVGVAPGQTSTADFR
jgi:uncharacterized protein (TIGR03000 family)